MFKTISPIDNSVLLERKYDSNKIEQTIDNSITAQKKWAQVNVKERVSLLGNFVKDFLSREDIIKEEMKTYLKDLKERQLMLEKMLEFVMLPL